MATSSFLNNINIKGRKNVEAFITALELAEQKESKEVVLNGSCEEVRGEKIKEILGYK